MITITTKKIAEQGGRSMIEMLGVLAIIGVLTLGSVWGYQKAITKSRVNKTVEAVALALQSYSDFVLRGAKGARIEGEYAVETASNIHLIDNCRILKSQVSGETNYRICEVPLGEMYVQFHDVNNTNKRSYMLSLMMIDQDKDVCTTFLTQAWDQIIPAEWWKNGMIWLKSDDTDSRTVYPENNNGNVSITDIANACASACPEGTEHCMVVFDFAS